MFQPARFMLLVMSLFTTTLMADVIRVPFQFVESGWLSEARETACEMKQDLPFFGSARFVRDAHQPVQLVIDSLVPVHKPGEGRLYSVQPSWKGGGEEEDIATFVMEQGVRPIVLPRTQALQVFYALYQGRAVHLEFDDLATGSSRMLLQLSPIDFLTQVQAFETCVGRLSRIPEPAPAQVLENDLIDETRIQLRNPPQAAPAGLLLRPLPADTPSLSYQFDSDGNSTPVRIRTP